MRQIINDSSVFQIWECPGCDKATEVNPSFYSEMGTPMCAECDIDMEYIGIEIELGVVPCINKLTSF